MRPDRHRGRIALITVAIVVVGYLLLIGWHRQQEYVEWRVWTLAAVLAATVLVAAVRGAGMPIALVMAVALTVVWSVDAVTDTSVEEPDFWPVGAMFLAIGAGLGSLLIVGIVEAGREVGLWFRRRRS